MDNDARLILAKRLTDEEKKEIIKSFTEGKSIDFLSRNFNCTKLTIIRNLKIILGEQGYKKLLNDNKKKIFKKTFDEPLKNEDFFHESTNKDLSLIHI